MTEGRTFSLHIQCSFVLSPVLYEAKYVRLACISNRQQVDIARVIISDIDKKDRIRFIMYYTKGDKPLRDLIYKNKDKIKNITEKRWRKSIK